MRKHAYQTHKAYMYILFALAKCQMAVCWHRGHVYIKVKQCSNGIVRAIAKTGGLNVGRFWGLLQICYCFSVLSNK